MTHNEIAKGLECCVKSKCKECSFNRHYDTKGTLCTLRLAENALDLINRQKAQIKGLQDEVLIKTSMYNDMKSQRDKEHQYCMHYITMIAKAKAEAIKEFVERLKEIMAITYETVDGSRGYQTEDYFIDNLVEEMTEGNK